MRRGHVGDRPKRAVAELVGDSPAAWDGSAANGVTTPAAISADGRYVVLNSGATNLVPEPDTNNDQPDVFVLDRTTDAVTRVSLGPTGVQGDRGMNGLSISDDGRYVGMGSSSSNFGIDNSAPCPDPENGCRDPYSMGYVRDLQTGTTTLITVDGNGVPGNEDSGYPMLSGDGRFATYWSRAINLGAVPNMVSVLVSDLGSGAIENVGAISNIPTISRDGRFVAMDNNGIIVHDRATGTDTRADLTKDGSLPDATGFSAIISADGTAIAFGSYATDLVPGDTNTSFDVFAHQLITTPTTTPPPAPSSVTAAAGDGHVSVSWAAPASDGGSPITSYTVTSSPGDLTTTTTGATSATITGLANDTPYTFTVSATNAIGTGPSSDPSDPVTPQAGTASPQTTTETVPVGTSVTATTDPTNSGPTPSDPVTTSVTVPPTSDGGTVSVAETAVTETAPVGGYQFFGQQIDITSTAGTSASNPLTIVFTIDSSVIRTSLGLAPSDPLPAPASVDITRAEGSSSSPAIVGTCISTGGDGNPIDPDPCVSNRDYINNGDDLRITILTGSASHWNTAIKPVAVTVADNGYSPKTVTVAQGGIVIWTFAGSKSHSATENLKLGPAKAALFTSGALASGRYGYLFRAASTYTYGSTVKGDPGSFAGSVAVPVGINPTSGGTSTSFAVTWSSSALTGYVFDVQYRFMKAGSKTWSPLKSWKAGVAATSATFRPSSGKGTYAFSARLRNSGTGINALWSPEATFVVR